MGGVVGIGRISIATGKDANDGWCDVKASVRIRRVLCVAQDRFVKVVS